MCVINFVVYNNITVSQIILLYIIIVLYILAQLIVVICSNNMRYLLMHALLYTNCQI